MKDIARVAAIREAVGGDVKIRVDANQGWTAKETIRILTAMEDKGLDIDLCEQPVKAHDSDGMRTVTKAVAMPILADESVFSPADAIEIIRTHAADLINIKLMKTGGSYNALKICAIAETYGVECMIGCMLEKQNFGQRRRPSGRRQTDYHPCRSRRPLALQNRPVRGRPRFIENRIVMNDRPGIGIESIPMAAIRCSSNERIFCMAAGLH